MKHFREQLQKLSDKDVEQHKELGASRALGAARVLQAVMVTPSACISDREEAERQNAMQCQVMMLRSAGVMSSGQQALQGPRTPTPKETT